MTASKAAHKGLFADGFVDLSEFDYSKEDLSAAVQASPEAIAPAPQTQTQTPTPKAKTPSFYDEGGLASETLKTDDADSAVWRRCPQSSGPQNIHQRIAQLRSVAELVRACLGSPEEFLTLAKQLSQVENEAQSLLSFVAGNSYDLKSAEMDIRLDVIEHAIAEIECRLSSTILRKRACDRAPTARCARDVLQFQFEARKIGRKWWTHLDLAATNALSVDEGVGLTPKSPGSASKILEDILPTSNISENKRRKEVRYFSECMAQVKSMPDAAQIFTGPTYLEVQKHKIDLGRSYFDPAVFYAGACLSIAMERARRTLVSKSLDPHTLEIELRELQMQSYEYLCQVHSGPQKVAEFGETLKSPRRRAYDETRAFCKGEERARGELDRERKKYSQLKAKIGRYVLAVSAVGAIALAYPVVSAYRGERARDLHEISSQQCGALHPALQSASVGGTKRSFLMAKIDAEIWVEMSDGERQQLAASLARNMDRSALDSAMVYHDDLLVLSIVAGTATYIERAASTP